MTQGVTPFTITVNTTAGTKFSRKWDTCTHAFSCRLMWERGRHPPVQLNRAPAWHLTSEVRMSCSSGYYLGFISLLWPFLFFLARRKTATVVWAKPFGSEKLNKRDFELFGPCFYLFCLLTYSPQTFSVTVSAVAPANLLKLPIYFWANRITVIRQTANELYQFISSPWLAVSCNSVFYSKFPG